MRPHRAFARQNAFGYWEGCIEYPCGTVSAVTNAKHTEGAALDIAQRMIEGADERLAEKERRHERLRQNWRLYGSVLPGTVSVPANAPHQARAIASRPECSCSASGYDPECKWEGHHHA